MLLKKHIFIAVFIRWKEVCNPPRPGAEDKGTFFPEGFISRIHVAQRKTLLFIKMSCLQSLKNLFVHSWLNIACGEWGRGDKLISCPLQAATEQRKLLDNLLHTALVALLPDVKTKNIFVRQKQVFESVKYKHFILEAENNQNKCGPINLYTLPLNILRVKKKRHNLCSAQYFGGQNIQKPLTK